MKPSKIVYYDDPLNDEFSGTNITHRPLPKNFKYHHTNWLYRACAWTLYYLIIYPFGNLIYRLFLHYKVVGNKRIKGIMGKPVFFYGNHTQIADAGIAQLLASRAKRTYIITNQDTTSIKGIRGLVCMIGAIPTPETPEQRQGFVEAIKYHCKHKCGIAIFPEAHIWPYSTHIRPFGDDSFVYPAEIGAPVVAMCTTYRPRRFFKKKPPVPTLHISKPIMPDMSLSMQQRKKQLRDAVYEYMVDTSSNETNVEWIAYVKRPEGK